jgi:hypothetical protein
MPFFPLVPGGPLAPFGPTVRGTLTILFSSADVWACKTEERVRGDFRCRQVGGGLKFRSEIHVLQRLAHTQYRARGRGGDIRQRVLPGDAIGCIRGAQ